MARNDLWFDHPLNTYFGPIYSFIRNREPWPMLHTLKTHFDQA